MRFLTSLLGIAVLLLGLSSAALAETKVKVNVKEPKPKTVVKAETRIRTEPVVAFSTDAGKTVVVKPLDAAGNPYVKVYTDWDKWVIANARPDIRFSDLHWMDGRWVYTDPQNGDVEVTVAQVTPEGYLVPASDKSVVAVGPTQVPLLPRAAATGNYYVIATGVPAPAVHKVYVTERARVLATVAPPVPDWIIKQPGQRVIFTPDKDFIVERGNIWVRYDAAGKVIAQTRPGESWRVLFWPKYADVVTAAPAKNWTVLEDNGYVVVRDGTGKIVNVYDYDGTPLKVEDVKVTREPIYYTPLDWDTLTDLHNAQVHVEPNGDVHVKVNP